MLRFASAAINSPRGGTLNDPRHDANLKLEQEGWPPTTRAGMRAFLEYLHDWIGEIGYYYDPRLLLRSPLLVG
jgi:hypothetical protein